VDRHQLADVGSTERATAATATRALSENLFHEDYSLRRVFEKDGRGGRRGSSLSVGGCLQWYRSYRGLPRPFL
jgi:hypothetical protein